MATASGRGSEEARDAIQRLGEQEQQLAPQIISLERRRRRAQWAKWAIAVSTALVPAIAIAASTRLFALSDQVLVVVATVLFGVASASLLLTGRSESQATEREALLERIRILDLMRNPSLETVRDVERDLEKLQK